MIVVIIFLAAPGRCFVSNNNMLLKQEKATKTAVLTSSNVLFGIFTGVINFYYICSYKIDDTQITKSHISTRAAVMWDYFALFKVSVK